MTSGGGGAPDPESGCAAALWSPMEPHAAPAQRGPVQLHSPMQPRAAPRSSVFKFRVGLGGVFRGFRKWLLGPGCAKVFVLQGFRADP